MRGRALAWPLMVLLLAGLVLQTLRRNGRLLASKLINQVEAIAMSAAASGPADVERVLPFELAALRREGKKDVPPIRVEVFQLENSVVVAYLFPLSAEIGRKDDVVEFSALIGRLQVSQHFLVGEMQFQGKLEL